MCQWLDRRSWQTFGRILPDDENCFFSFCASVWVTVAGFKPDIDNTDFGKFPVPLPLSLSTAGEPGLHSSVRLLDFGGDLDTRLVCNSGSASLGFFNRFFEDLAMTEVSPVHCETPPDDVEGTDIRTSVSRTYQHTNSFATKNIKKIF